MTPKEMIAMAREAGCVEPSHPFNPWSVSQEALKRFAALVVAAALAESTVKESLIAQRPWVGLTEDEANEYNYLGPDMLWVVQEVEAKLKDKNCG